MATTQTTSAPADRVPSGAEYHRVLAGPRRRIGRGVVAIVLLLLGMLVAGFLTAQGAALLDTALGHTDPAAGGSDITPVSQAGNLVALALMLPWSMLVLRWLYGLPMRSLHSVASRFRFALVGRAILFVGPLWIIVIVTSTIVPDRVPWSTADLLAMFAVTLLLTPLQSAGEEYALRGLTMRVVGGWTRGARAGLVLGTVISSVLFVSLHLSTDPWRNAYYLAPAIAFSLITWRTGGLETAVVVHALNNTLLFMVDLVAQSDFPSLEERASGGGTALLLIPAAGLALVTVVVWFRTRRDGPELTPERPERVVGDAAA